MRVANMADWFEKVMMTDLHRNRTDFHVEQQKEHHVYKSK